MDAEWAAGATVRLVIVNTGGAQINGWTVAFSLPDGVRTAQGWNGVWTQAGSRVVVRDAGYNAQLAPGQTLGNVGANLDGATGRRAPLASGFTLNGMPCQAA